LNTGQAVEGLQTGSTLASGKFQGSSLEWPCVSSWEGGELNSSTRLPYKPAISFACPTMNSHPVVFTFLDWSQVQNILLWVPEWDGAVPIPAIVKPKPLWSGKQILSVVIPRGINIHHSPDPRSSNPVFDNGMMIENGKIIFGIVEKKTVGASQGGLVHVVFHKKGPDPPFLLNLSVRSLQSLYKPGSV